MAEQAANATGEQLANARRDLNNWELAEVSVQLAAAQEEMAALSGVSDQLAQGLAQIESANRTLAEGPQRVATAEQRLAKAKESHASALQAQQAATSAAADREAVIHQTAELVKSLEAQATKPSADPSIAKALAKAKESLDLLKAGLEPLRQSAATTAAAAKKAADELTAAETALSAAKSELQAAPAQLEEGRKRIAAATRARWARFRAQQKKAA